MGETLPLGWSWRLGLWAASSHALGMRRVLGGAREG